MRREWTGDPRDCFYKDMEQFINVQEFVFHADRNNFLAYYWPNYEAAPWHLQATFYITSEEETELNFWPHKSKGQFKYEKAIEPMSAFFAELSKRIKQPNDEDDFDVIE